MRFPELDCLRIYLAIENQEGNDVRNDRRKSLKNEE
jgi:hypothetical protein